MRYSHTFLVITFVLLLFSCRKAQSPYISPPSVPVKKVLLKDIIIPLLPSPYYHFEYNTDSMVTKVDFGSGFTMYDVFYIENKIGEMRNNIFVNHDTLRYSYDAAGKVTIIKFINEANVIYRHVTFSYNGSQVKEIDWDHKDANAGFIIDRTLTFTYYPDGNVKTITEHRPTGNDPGFIAIRQFYQYDNKVNVDDFSRIHDGIHDHLFLLQGFRLQRNNPGKETYSGGAGLASYTIDYTYTYNNDNAPSERKGDLLFTAGANAGQRFHESASFTYY